MAFTNFTVLGWTVFSLLGQTTIVWLNWDYYQNKCCGVRNALLEYKESRWFINQRYSPRLYLPASCTESENQLQNNRIILMGCREVIQQETLRGNTVICALSAVSAIIYSVYVRKMLKSHSAKRYEVV
uniref:Uncharacterized protein n=1 Tax=Ditylenchus dipsaci TaxID=166011 RepID=A0A915CNR0_9BILA